MRFYAPFDRRSRDSAADYSKASVVMAEAEPEVGRAAPRHGRAERRGERRDESGPIQNERERWLTAVPSGAARA